MLLQADPLFQQYLTDYTKAETKFAEYNGKWGAQHPEVITVQGQVQQARSAMLQRGESLLGHPLLAQDERVQLLLSHDVDKRGQLLQELITADAEKHGVAAQVDTLQRTLQELEGRLQQNSEAAAGLADLNRQHQVATVIFTSALAQLDLGKSNPFTSYPLVQVLAAPTRPKQPDSLKHVLALLGATCGSILTLIGFASLMAPPRITPENFEERVIWYAITGTYVFYAIGAVYIVAPVLAWILVLRLLSVICGRRQPISCSTLGARPWRCGCGSSACF